MQWGAQWAGPSRARCVESVARLHDSDTSLAKASRNDPSPNYWISEVSGEGDKVDCVVQVRRPDESRRWCTES